MGENLIMENIWTFETKRFAVILDCEYDDCDLSWDETGETQEKCDAGIWHCVCFRVRVLLDDEQVGVSYLSNSVYEDVTEFAREHRDPDFMYRNCSRMRAIRGEKTCICTYFPEMVHEAIAEARAAIKRRVKNAPYIREAKQ